MVSCSGNAFETVLAFNPGLRLGLSEDNLNKLKNVGTSLLLRLVTVVKTQRQERQRV